ncbi:MAG: hypothetical protein QOC65_154 [Sphingomonadales bacterium]|nr:hypothetical protein [Sphingomonadales bacterium]
MPALLALVAALAPAASPDEPEDRQWLLSIEGIALGANEYIDGFAIDTWAVRVVSVCHIPGGWTIRAGGRASPDGVIAGEASHGVTFIADPRLPQLRDLALVRIPAGAEARDRLFEDPSQPLIFDGRAEIGTYGNDETRRRTARITRANIRLVPAARCPDPRD